MSTWERLGRTKIYQTLSEKEEKSHHNQEVISLINSVSTIVKETDILLTHIQDTFPEYTLHDSTHSVKIVELMDKIIPDKTLKSLNALELSILILSAYLHDIGMVKSREETRSILKSREFIAFREENAEISQSIEEAIKIGDNRTLVELEDFLVTEFIRNKHGERTYEYILETYRNNPLVEYYGVNFAEDLALICKSHTFDALDLAKREGDNLIEAFRRDKIIHNEEVNVQYLAVCLRLADIMDFDRERTPKNLFKYISPKNKISLNEWMKHLSITGWRIKNNEIRFEAECTHPVYQNVLYKFIDQIDAELECCNILVKDNNEEISKKYKLNLPTKVYRKYISSKGFCYGPFEFSLDYDRIIALLMGEQLYDSKDIFIRELLQNSIDACRHRQAFEKLNGKDDYKPIIRFTHGKKDGYDFVEVEDNGIGMDMYIVQNYFMKIGVSYYQSKDFDKYRIEFKKKGFDFDPISRFGIGILSCFMVADRVAVETYKAKSVIMEKNQSLEIEIEGPSQFIVIRKGKKNIYGTKITLFLKKDQKVDLLEILKKYAKHVEFPITIKTEQTSKPIELIDEGFRITYQSKLGGAELELEKKISVIEIDLSKNKRFKGLKGKLNIYFLKDDNGNICFEKDDIEISSYNFVKRMNKKTFFDIALQVYPYIDKENLLTYLSDKNIEIDGMSFRDFISFFEDYSFSEGSTGGLFSPLLFKDSIDRYYDRFMNISSFNEGSLSCDGILTNLPRKYSNSSIRGNMNIELPNLFDINVIGEDKPNLRVARDEVADDDSFNILLNKIKIIIADNLYEHFLNNKMSNIPEQQYIFFTKLCESKQNFMVFKELLKIETFRRKVPIIKIQKGEKLIYSSLIEIINDFSGTVYLSASKPEIELLHSMKNEAWIDKSEDRLIDLIACSSELTFFTNETTNKSYFKLSLQNIDNIQYDKNLFTFAEYSGKYKEVLLCKNRLNALNSGHAISKIYFKLKDENGISNKEIILIFERLFKEIINQWRMTEGDFNKIDNIVKEIRSKISFLNDINNKDLDEITVNKDDFHFW